MFASKNLFHRAKQARLVYMYCPCYFFEVAKKASCFPLVCKDYRRFGKMYFFGCSSLIPFYNIFKEFESKSYNNML